MNLHTQSDPWDFIYNHSSSERTNIAFGRSKFDMLKDLSGTIVTIIRKEKCINEKTEGQPQCGCNLNSMSKPMTF